MSFRYTKPFARLIDEFSKMPGIGPKTAQRLAFYILKNSSESVGSLAKTILEAKEKVKHCSICGNITDQEICEICQNINRDKSIICVVEKVRDLISIENSRAITKLLINGEPARPFSLNCLSPRTGYPELKSKLEELSRLTYGRELSEVESDIVKKLTSEQKVI